MLGSRAAVLRLTGDDGRWNDPAAALDPARSVGGTAAAAELRILTDDLVAVLHTESPRLIAATSLEQWRRAALAGRTGAGLLRYHVLMARSTPTRVARLLGERDAMMAANLLAIREAEGPPGRPWSSPTTSTCSGRRARGGWPTWT